MLVEGIQMKTQRISHRLLAAAWKTLSDKPLPNVKALQLSDDDFNHVLEHRHCIEDEFRDIEEWGRILPTQGTDACIFNGEEEDDAEFVILVRKNPYHSLEEIIVHELSHIARGDL
jgi:hypothetical protein